MKESLGGERETRAAAVLTEGYIVGGREKKGEKETGEVG